MSGTWYFSSDGGGRFDLAPPNGTCYLATDEYAAIREASRVGPVSMEWVKAREIRTIEAPEGHFAQISHRRAGRFGLTNELVTITPYTLPQQWAAAFHARGHAGIRHFLRHDQRGRASGVSVFGPGGPGEGADSARERLTPERVRAAGVAVLERPHSSVLHVLG